jgi:hypothetical protein
LIKILDGTTYKSQQNLLEILLLEIQYACILGYTLSRGISKVRANCFSNPFFFCYLNIVLILLATMATTLLCVLLLLCQIATSTPTLKLKDGNKQASVPLTKRLYTNATLPSKNFQLVSTYSKLKLPVPPAVQEAWDQEQAEKKNGSTLESRNNGFLEKRLEGQQTSTSAG